MVDSPGSRVADGKVTLIENGNGACNTGYVDDLVDAVFLAIETEKAVGETFYITDGERITWGEYIRAHLPMVENAPSLNEISKQEVRDYSAAAGVDLGIDSAERPIIAKPRAAHAAAAHSCHGAGSNCAFGDGCKLNRKKSGNGSSAFSPSDGASPESNGEFSMPEEVTVATQTGTVFFSIDKAKRILGYEPRVPFIVWNYDGGAMVTLRQPSVS